MVKAFTSAVKNMSFVLVAAAVFCIFSGQAAAQDRTALSLAMIPYQSPYNFGPRFDAMAVELLQREPARFNYNIFRRYYASTEQYDPFAEAREQMLDLAYKIIQKENPEDALDLLDAYGELLIRHLGNIGIVAQAIALSRDDQRFGDTELLTKIRDRLFEEVLISGDGVTLTRAYDVITLEEEVMLLRHLRVKVLDTKFVQEGRIQYNMHTVQKHADEKPYTIFVDVSLPMRHTQEKQYRNPSTFEIGKQ